MTRLIAIALLATAMPALAAEQRFPVSGFQRVAASGSEDVVISTGKAISVVATGPQERLDRLDIRVEGDTLKIGHKRGKWNDWGNDDDVTIRVTMPVLHGVSMAGSGNLTADNGGGPAFSASIAGSGDVRVANINSPTVSLSTAGSGDTVVGGKCTSAKISIAGSGNTDTKALKCTNIEVAISGSGDVDGFATGNALVRISGSGDVKVAGGAKCQSRTSGSGTVSCG